MTNYGAALAITLAAIAPARADERTIEEVPAPERAVPLREWTPAQQYLPVDTRRSTGFTATQFGMLVFADELGDKLSELGRFSVIDRWFRSGRPSLKSTVFWALCGSDVMALDMAKLEAELDAEHIGAQSRALVLQRVKGRVAEMKEDGAAIEAAAKDDPGLAKVLAVPEQAKTEWAAYLAQHKEEFERYLALKDAVRSGMSNHKNFAGCWEATQPAFAKLVRAAKFPWEASGSYLTDYMAEIQKSTETYITTASFGACAYSVDKSGEILAAAALSTLGAGTIRVGWRTLATAKLIDPAFKPKFTNRDVASLWNEYELLYDLKPQVHRVDGVGDGSFVGMVTPQQGVIGKVQKADDMLKLSFKGDEVETCLQWVDTRKVQSVGPNGDVTYEKVCKKRGKVANQENDVQVAPRFADGLKPGVSVLLIQGFPVTAWKGKQFVSVFGVTTKK